MNLIIILCLIILIGYIINNKYSAFGATNQDVYNKFKDVINPNTHLKINPGDINAITDFSLDQLMKLTPLEIQASVKSSTPETDDYRIKSNTSRFNLNMGSYLSTEIIENNDVHKIYSPDSKMTLSLLNSGNVIIYNNTTPLTTIYHTNTANRGNAPYYFGTSFDGSINLVDSTNTILWGTLPVPTSPFLKYTVELRNGGGFLMYHRDLFSNNINDFSVPFPNNKVLKVDPVNFASFITNEIFKNVGNPSTHLKITPADVQSFLNSQANNANIIDYSIKDMKNWCAQRGWELKIAKIIPNMTSSTLEQGSCIASAGGMRSTQLVNNGKDGLAVIQLQDDYHNLMLYWNHVPCRMLSSNPDVKGTPPYYFGMNEDGTATFIDSLGTIIWSTDSESNFYTSTYPTGILGPYKLTLDSNGLISIYGNIPTLPIWTSSDSELFLPVNGFNNPMDPITSISPYPGASAYGNNYTEYTCPNLIPGVIDRSNNPFLYKWVCPANVKRISVLCISGGGGGGVDADLNKQGYDCEGNKGAGSYFGDIVYAEGGPPGPGCGVRVLYGSKSKLDSKGDVICYGYPAGEGILHGADGWEIQPLGGGGAAGYIPYVGHPKGEADIYPMGGGHNGGNGSVAGENSFMYNEMPPQGGGGTGVNGAIYNGGQESLMYLPNNSLGGDGGGNGGFGTFEQLSSSMSVGASGGAFGGGGGGNSMYNVNKNIKVQVSLPGMGGGGGTLVYSNDIPVVPGQTYLVSVGAGGKGGHNTETNDYGGKGGGGAVKIIWGSNAGKICSFPYFVPKSPGIPYAPLELVSTFYKYKTLDQFNIVDEIVNFVAVFEKKAADKLIRSFRFNLRHRNRLSSLAAFGISYANETLIDKIGAKIGTTIGKKLIMTTQKAAIKIAMKVITKR